MLSELDNIISKIRVVKAGDIILADDHNLQTDAIKKIRDILKQLRQQIAVAGAVEPDWSGWSEVKTTYHESTVMVTPAGAYSGFIVISNNKVADIWLSYMGTDRYFYRYRLTVSLPDLSVVNEQCILGRVIPEPYTGIGYEFLNWFSMLTGKYRLFLVSIPLPDLVYEVWKEDVKVATLDFTDLGNMYPDYWHCAISHDGRYILFIALLASVKTIWMRLLEAYA